MQGESHTPCKEETCHQDTEGIWMTKHPVLRVWTPRWRTKHHILLFQVVITFIRGLKSLLNYKGLQKFSYLKTLFDLTTRVRKQSVVHPHPASSSPCRTSLRAGHTTVTYRTHGNLNTSQEKHGTLIYCVGWGQWRACSSLPSPKRTPRDMQIAYYNNRYILPS